MLTYKLILFITGSLLYLSSSAATDPEYLRVEKNVFFQKNDSELTSEAQSVISHMFPFQSDYYPEYILISGHTDTSGSNAYNYLLSKKRALSVKRFITEHFISNTDFKLHFLGEEQPAFSCDQHLNRSVNILMVLKRKEEPASLARCRELFPEEFSVNRSDASSPLINHSNTSSITDSTFTEHNTTSQIISEPVPPENEVLSELKPENKFLKKILTEKKDSLRLNDILFYGNSDRFYATAESELHQLSEFLSHQKNYFISISGHVNGGRNSSRILRKESPFADAYELSLARAEAVKDFLVKEGISPDRIRVAGKGGEEPIYKHPKTDSESEANRRIEVRFTKI